MADSLQERFHVRSLGSGDVTLLFVHGLGCNQAMWRFVAPELSRRDRVVLMDLMGCGSSDWSAWQPVRYASLEAHASDVVEVARTVCTGTTVLVGHSVGAMIGLLADRKAPGLFRAHAMIAPSPCYMNEADYQGGFARDTLEHLVAMIDDDPRVFARNMAAAVMGTQAHSEPAQELQSAWCASHPDAFRQFARATFLGDHRSLLASHRKPTLVVQAEHDVIAPVAVGNYLAGRFPDVALQTLPVKGHFPTLLCRKCVSTGSATSWPRGCKAPTRPCPANPACAPTGSRPARRAGPPPGPGSRHPGPS